MTKLTNHDAMTGYPADAIAHPAKSLFFQRRFLHMWLGQSFGALADNMNRQVLLIGVPFGTVALVGFENSDAAIPLIGALFPIAMLIGSMFGGQFAEKYETREMFRLTKIAELALMMLAALGLIINQGWFIVTALFGMGLQSAFFNPTRQSAMPKYLRRDELIRGNGLVNAGLYACILLGYGIGGALIAIEPRGSIYAAFVLMAFSGLGLAAVWHAPRAAATHPDLSIDWSGIRPALAMIRFTMSEAGVIRPLLGIALFYFASTAITVLLPIFCRDTLGADGSATTMIILLFAVGAGIGAIGSAILARNGTGLGLSTIGISLSCGFMIIVYFVSRTFDPVSDGPLLNATALFSQPNGIVLGALLCLSSVSMGLYLAPLQAAMQRRAPDERRARILAVGNMLYALAAMLGSLAVLGITQTALHPEQAFIIIALLLLATSAYMLRRHFTVPQGLYDE